MSEPSPETFHPSQEITSYEAKREDIQEAWHLYKEGINDTDSPQAMGLDEKTFKEIYFDGDVIKALVSRNQLIYETPVLIPTEKLYWYNQDLLMRTYPGKATFLYTQVNPTESVVKTSAQCLKEGNIIIFNSDSSRANHSRELEEAIESKIGQDIKRESLKGAFLNQYAGEVRFENKGFSQASTFFEAYEKMLAKGELSEGSYNGASLIDVAKPEEAERLWQIYQKPFEDISQQSPINAGFDEEGFKNALNDPSVVKVVNKENGVITTLAMFATDFSHAEWLNERYYRENYPEAYGTNNILIFTGIVSDEKMRGSMYSLELIKLLLQVGQDRNTNSLITFECNEVSSNYLPKLVELAINRTGLAVVQGLEKPIAQSRFHCISLAI